MYHSLMIFFEKLLRLGFLTNNNISLLIEIILNLFMNGLLLLLGTDYTTGSGDYTLTNTPSTTLNEIVQQTFARAGAA